MIPNQTKREEDLLSKISPVILSITRHYPRFFKAEMAYIYENYFKPENLYKFCHLKGCEDKNRDNNITFKNSPIKIKKVISTLCDFRNTIKIWLNNFLNYSIVLIDFFGVAFSFLFRSFILIYAKIRHLSHIYNW